MAEPLPLDRNRPLVGRDLRHAALVVLHRWGAGSIAEVIERLGAGGFAVAGDKPNKVVSDALRHEVRRGRLQRVGWGRYAVKRLARTTSWRIGLRWDAALPANPVDPADSGPRPSVPGTRPRRTPQRGPLVALHRGCSRWRTGRERVRARINRQRIERRLPQSGAATDAAAPLRR